ncbi:lamin tail domain-containing protein [Halorientalis halophila]|uniref:lamin tail domain-containing protein n=1 Tax=Halorientalis halophila TaxID=3108499 RepID=UPI00300920FD
MDRSVAAFAALVVLVLTAGCVGLSPDTQSAPEPPEDADLAASYPVTVTAVVDGDTIKIRFENGTQDTVRLLGVDTPETQSENDPAEFEGVPETEAGRSCLREAGHDATRTMTQRLLGERVTIGLDAESDGRGYYDRLLAYVYEDDENVNYRLVADGDGRVYDSQFTERATFDAAEQRARENGTGVWACATDSPPTPTPEPIADGGEVTDGPLAVATIHEDAEGHDGQNLNDEYVVFENRGEETLDLSGWTVSDEADHRYMFADGTALAPDEQVTLRTGSGTNSGDTLYWGQSQPVWNNGGDTVTVRAANGTVMVREAY